MTPEELGLILVQMPRGEASSLWDVITALRGPDNEDEDIKRATTEVIRWHLLGKDTYMLQFSGSLCGPDSEDERQMRIYLLQQGEANLHFCSHALKAFKALGLVWDKVNT